MCQTLVVAPFSSWSIKDEWFVINFYLKSPIQIVFISLLVKYVISAYFQHSFVCLCDFAILARPVCFDFPSLCIMFLSFGLSAIFFDSGWKITFNQVHIQSMAFASSMLQILKHWYSWDLNTIILVGIYTMLFCAINMMLWVCLRNYPFYF